MVGKNWGGFSNDWKSKIQRGTAIVSAVSIVSNASLIQPADQEKSEHFRNHYRNPDNQVRVQSRPMYQ